MNLESGKLRLATVAAVIVVVIGATKWLTSSIDAAKSDMKISTANLGNQLQNLTTTLDEVKSNSYTLSKASEQALRTAIENPGFRVPDPRDPNKIIVVFSAKTGASELKEK